MFRALGQLLRGIVAIFTGRADRAADTFQKNPDAMRAEYDAIIAAQRRRLEEFSQVDAATRAERARKMQQREAIGLEIEKFTRAVAGAKAKLKACKEALEAQGKTRDQIEQDPEYIRWRDAFKNYSTTLEEKKARAGDLDGGVARTPAR